MILNDSVVNITQINAYFNHLYLLVIFVLFSGCPWGKEGEDTGNNLGLLVRRAARIYSSDGYQSIREDTFEVRIQTSRY